MQISQRHHVTLQRQFSQIISPGKGMYHDKTYDNDNLYICHRVDYKIIAPVKSINMLSGL